MFPPVCSVCGVSINNPEGKYEVTVKLVWDGEKWVQISCEPKG